MTDRIDLDAIEARYKAATPGPWIARRGKAVTFVLALDGSPLLKSCITNDLGAQHDAIFATHARTDVPAMAQALREAREVIEYMARLSVVTTGAKQDCADWLARWFGK